MQPRRPEPVRSFLFYYFPFLPSFHIRRSNISPALRAQAATLRCTRMPPYYSFTSGDGESLFIAFFFSFSMPPPLQARRPSDLSKSPMPLHYKLQCAHICKVRVLFVWCEYTKVLTFHDRHFNPQMDGQCDNKSSLFSFLRKVRVDDSTNRARGHECCRIWGRYQSC